MNYAINIIIQVIYNSICFAILCENKATFQRERPWDLEGRSRTAFEIKYSLAFRSFHSPKYNSHIEHTC